MKTTAVKKIAAAHLLILASLVAIIFVFVQTHHSELLLISVIPGMVIFALTTASLAHDNASDHHMKSGTIH